MTNEDIIRMACEAGLTIGTNISGITLVGSPAEIGIAHITLAEIHRFAALVAAAERDACAKVCDERAAAAPMGSDEQCEAEDCATAIRARRQHD